MLQRLEMNCLRIILGCQHRMTQVRFGHIQEAVEAKIGAPRYQKPGPCKHQSSIHLNTQGRPAPTRALRSWQQESAGAASDEGHPPAGGHPLDEARAIHGGGAGVQQQGRHHVAVPARVVPHKGQAVQVQVFQGSTPAASQPRNGSAVPELRSAYETCKGQYVSEQAEPRAANLPMVAWYWPGRCHWDSRQWLSLAVWQGDRML